MKPWIVVAIPLIVLFIVVANVMESSGYEYQTVKETDELMLFAARCVRAYEADFDVGSGTKVKTDFYRMNRSDMERGLCRVVIFRGECTKIPGWDKEHTYKQDTEDCDYNTYENQSFYLKNPENE